MICLFVRAYKAPQPSCLLVFSSTLITPAQRRAGNPLVYVSSVLSSSPGKQLVNWSKVQSGLVRICALPCQCLRPPSGCGQEHALRSAGFPSFEIYSYTIALPRTKNRNAMGTCRWACAGVPVCVCARKCERAVFSSQTFTFRNGWVSVSPAYVNQLQPKLLFPDTDTKINSAKECLVPQVIRSYLNKFNYQ